MGHVEQGRSISHIVTSGENGQVQFRKQRTVLIREHRIIGGNLSIILLYSSKKREKSQKLDRQ